MPDVLAHYALSYLVASRILRPRHAALAAIAGVAPDIDALIGVHRWLTHSIAPPLLAAIIAYTTLRHTRYATPAILITALIALHNTLDTLTAPTPLLWPLTRDAYAININIDAAITHHTITIHTTIDTTTEQMNTESQEVIEGPLVTTTGVVLAITAVIVALTGYLARGRSGR